MKERGRIARAVFVFSLVLIFAVTGLYADQNGGAGARRQKILIAYFSRVGSSESFADVDAVSSASLPNGNTITIAKMIRTEVGGDLFQIVTE